MAANDFVINLGQNLNNENHRPGNPINNTPFTRGEERQLVCFIQFEQVQPDEMKQRILKYARDINVSYDFSGARFNKWYEKFLDRFLFLKTRKCKVNMNLETFN